MISACTPQEPEMAATIVVQRPTFTPSPLQPTEAPTATATLPVDNTDEGNTAFPHWTGPTYTPTPPPTPPFGLTAWPPECIPPTESVPDWQPCRFEPLPDERWVIMHYGQEICTDQQRR